MIASSLCVGTINAYHSGIGGVSILIKEGMSQADDEGGFMLIRFNNEDGSHGYEMIDFRETMPAAGNETVGGLEHLIGERWLMIRCTPSTVSTRLSLPSEV
jgi:hypothetical protein